MYAVTIDTQNITGTELEKALDEVIASADSVSGNDAFSEAYLGKYLALAGKQYFMQVDITDQAAAELYDVEASRSLSEGITGYEIRTSRMYGIVTGISEGSLYIDVDTDSHSVNSLKGDEEAEKEYLSVTGMMSSLYESIVWEQLTRQESVSTISVLQKAVLKQQSVPEKQW